MKTPNILKQILLLAHPVGCYYWSRDPTSPAILFGGSWTQVYERFVYATSARHPVDSQGGEETITLTDAQMPPHTHWIRINYQGGTNRDQPSYEPAHWNWNGESDLGAGRTSSTGGNQPHNNMPPYICAYCWYRTA